MKTNVIFIATVRLDCKDCYECGGYMKPHKTAYFRDQKTATDWAMTTCWEYESDEYDKDDPYKYDWTVERDIIR